MTVSHVWLGGSIQDAGLEEGVDPKSALAGHPDWHNLERTAILCNRAVFMDEDPTKSDNGDLGQSSVPIQQRGVYGDASEAAILRCTESTCGNVMDYRSSYPKAVELPFSSVSIFLIKTSF
jgi:hypothetical protein